MSANNKYQLYDVLFGNKNITIIVENTIDNDKLFNIICQKLNLNPSEYQLVNPTPTKLVLEHKKFIGGNRVNYNNLYKDILPITTPSIETASSDSDENNSANHSEDHKKNVINAFDRSHKFRIDYSKYRYD